MRRTVFVLLALALAIPAWAQKKKAPQPREGTKMVKFMVDGLTETNSEDLRVSLKKVTGVASALINTTDRTVVLTFADNSVISWNDLSQAVSGTNAQMKEPGLKIKGAPIAAVAGRFNIIVENLTGAQVEKARETLRSYKATDTVGHFGGLTVPGQKWPVLSWTITIKKGANLKFSVIWNAFTSSGTPEAKAQPKLQNCSFYTPIPKKKTKKKG